MRSFLLLLLFCGSAFGQAGVSDGSKPTHLDPSYIMPAGKIYINTEKMIKPRYGFTFNGTSIVCQGTRAACGHTAVPSVGSTGSWRVSCGTSHMSFDDPIVWPGQPGKTHLHTFFANNTTNAASVLTDMPFIGTSSCEGGTPNRSGYWIPSMVYHCPNPDIYGCDGNKNGTPIPPTSNNAYYKSGFLVYTDTQINSIVWPPAGLRMISGSASSVVPNSAIGDFNCDGIQIGMRIPTSDDATTTTTCDDLELRIGFSSCWDGVNLDSADHASHVAVPTGSSPNYCPVTHPVILPAISYNIHWQPSRQLTSWVITDLNALRLSSDLPEETGTLQAGSSTTVIILGTGASSINNYYQYGTIAFGGVSHYVTAYNGTTKAATVSVAFASAPAAGTRYAARNPAGSSAHADWVNGWDQTTILANGLTLPDTIVTNCLHTQADGYGRDCANGLLGAVDPAFPEVPDTGAAKWYRLANP